MTLKPHDLIGAKLNNGWVIISHQPSYVGSTGACHSVCFIAQKDSDTAFVKVLDTTIDQSQPDPLLHARNKIDVFRYERELVKKCQNHHLSAVVKALEHGDIIVPDYQNNIYYMIFEIADADLRKQTEINERFNLVFQFRVLHKTAVGLKQLHSAGIAHQDLKPSNILVFDNDDLKIGDLGHAHDSTNKRPGIDETIAGDPAYAPPEQLYKFNPDSWKARRLASDLYHLGSLVVYLITGVSATSGIQHHLRPEHQCHNWSGEEYSDILLFLEDATEAMIQETIDSVPDIYKERLSLLLHLLLDPVPEKRCHPRNRLGSGSLYGLERFVSGFDVLASRAELRLKKSLQK